MRTRKFVELTVLAIAVGAASTAWATIPEENLYSGQLCMGNDSADRDQLSYNASACRNEDTTNYAEVYCPITLQQADSGTPVDVDFAEAWVWIFDRSTTKGFTCYVKIRNANASTYASSAATTTNAYTTTSTPDSKYWLNPVNGGSPISEVIGGIVTCNIPDDSSDVWGYALVTN